MSESGREAEVSRLEAENARLQAENARLREATTESSDESFRLIFEKGTVPQTVVDRNGVFVRVNEAFARMVGYSAAELVGRPFNDITHPDDWSIGTSVLTAQIAGEPTARFEKRYITRAGATVYGDAFVAVVRDETGQPKHIAATVVDITEHKRAEEARRETHAELEAALSSMTDAVFISDAAGEFVHFNEAFATFHRFKSKSECARQLSDHTTVLDLYLPDGTLAPLDMWAVPRALRGETGADVEYRLRRKDTGETWIGSYNFAPVRGDDGVIVGSVVVAREVTEQKRAESTIRDYQKKLQGMALQAAMTEDRERRRIATELHDGIGQSLALVQIKLRAMRDTVAGSTRASLDETVGIIAESLESTRTLMFDLSPPVLYDLGLTDALSWLVDEFAKRYGITVNLRSDGSRPTLDDATAALVFRAVRELLMNVLKHAETREAAVTLRSVEGSLEVDVADRGAGFDATVALKSGGDRFGLFSVQQQIHQLGGLFEVDSRPGAGTRVRVKVPIPVASAQP